MDSSGDLQCKPFIRMRSDDAKSRMEDDHTRINKKILFPNRTHLILFPASEFKKLSEENYKFPRSRRKFPE